MSSSEEKDERLLKILRETYFEKEKLEIGNRWQEEAMSRIRTSGKPKAEPSPSMVFSQFTWKLAPVTVLLILVLTAFLIGSGFISGFEEFGFAFNGTEELTLAQIFPI
jgi:hypothetical protein